MNRSRFRPDMTPPVSASTITLLFYLVGCAVGPDYVAPEPAVPDAWHRELTDGLDGGEAQLQTWWRVFDDPVLQSLIDRARRGSLDLREAYARIQEARAIRGFARGGFLPFVDGFGDNARTRISEEIVPPVPLIDRTDDLFDAGFDVSWELDVFGRIRRSVESAEAGLQATVEDYRDALVTLYAEIARNYVEVRAVQARLRFALSNVQSQTETMNLTRELLDLGLKPELDLRQAELNLASTESTVPTLRTLLAQNVHRLGVLLGESPSSLFDELGGESAIPAVPEQVPVGLPTNLLRQRPDVRRAERELASQTAKVGVARADLYPRFLLVGDFALEARDIGKMWDQSARAYSYGPSIRWNLFQGGRIRNNIRVEEARTEQALISYERTVLLALEEVETNMTAFAEESQRRAILARAVAAAQRSVELVKTLYRDGLADFQNVLDTERSLFVRQDQLARSEGLVVQNLILLYKALGGGWAPGEAESEDPSTVETEGSS